MAIQKYISDLMLQLSLPSCWSIIYTVQYVHLSRYGKIYFAKVAFETK